MSDLVFRSFTADGDNSFSNNSIAAPVPTGTAAGDLMIVFISAGMVSPSTAPTITTPSGWTARGNSAQTIAGGVVNIRLYCFTKIATGSESSTTFTASGNSAFGYVRLSYQNPDPSTPFGQVTFGQGASSTSAVLTGITTTRNRALIATFLSQGVAQTATPPGSMTERSDEATDGAEVADEQRPTAGATGSRTFTLPTAADYAWMFAEFWSRTDGTLGVTLDNATMSATGAVKLQGVAVITTQDATSSGAGALHVQGSLAATLADATMSGTAALKLQGTLGATLADATLSATGQISSGITGTLSVTLDDATMSATGALKLQGAADILLQDASSSGAGGLKVQGVLDATLQDATMSATGVVTQPGTGQLAVTLEDATMSATGIISGEPTQTSGGGIAWYEREKRKAELLQRAQEIADEVPAEVIVEQQPGRPVVASALRTLRRAQAIHASPINVERLPEPVAVKDVAVAERAARIARDDDELLAMLGAII